MKSPSTLITLHEKAIQVLELMGKSELRISDLANNIIDCQKPYSQQPYWMQVDRHISAQLYRRHMRAIAAYDRIQNYYINLLNQIR